MRRRFLICSVGLVVSITLKPILTTAQQSTAKAKPFQNSNKSQGRPEPVPALSPDPSPYAGDETRKQFQENIAVQQNLAASTLDLARDTKKLANYTFWLVIVGIVIGGLQITIILFQLRYTAAAAGSARISADAAKKSADTAEESVRLTERADILLDSAGFERIGNNPFPDVVLHGKNFGRTRANNVVIEAKLIPGPGPNTTNKGFLPDLKPIIQNFEPMILAAGDGQGVRFTALQKWTLEFHSSVDRGLLTLRFEITVNYVDVFGKSHTTYADGSYISHSRMFRIERCEAD
jgi:hypothetical protein